MLYWRCCWYFFMLQWQIHFYHPQVNTNLDVLLWEKIVPRTHTEGHTQGCLLAENGLTRVAALYTFIHYTHILHKERTDRVSEKKIFCLFPLDLSLDLVRKENAKTESQKKLVNVSSQGRERFAVLLETHMFILPHSVCMRDSECVVCALSLCSNKHDTVGMNTGTHVDASPHTFADPDADVFFFFVLSVFGLFILNHT